MSGEPQALPWEPLFAARTGWDVLLATRSGKAAIALRQRERLAALLHAARGSPLMREKLAGIDPDTARLQDLPVSHKRELMARFDDWVTDRALHRADLERLTADRTRIAQPWLGRYQVWESSGSTGESALFVQDPHSLSVYDALESMRRPVLRPWQRLLDPLGLAERIAFVGATQGHFATTVSIQRLRALNPWVRAHVSNLSFLLPTADLVARLNELAPSVIATYPTMAVLLTDERLGGRLKIQLQEVWTGGETLSPAMRHYIEQGLGCPVANSYGCSEFMALASQCALGGLHLNSDWAILEPVDAMYRPVPAGELSATTLLTNLANHVQPLIRYDLGDRVAVSPHDCACGSPLPLIDVLGRNDELLRLSCPGRAAVTLAPLALTTVLEEDAGLFDFQLEQVGPAELRLRTGLVGTEARRLLGRAKVALSAYLGTQGLTEVAIHCHAGEPGQRGRSGKVERVVVRHDAELHDAHRASAAAPVATETSARGWRH